MRRVCIVPPLHLGDVTVQDYILRLLPDNWHNRFDVTLLLLGNTDRNHNEDATLWGKLCLVDLTNEEQTLPPIAPNDEFTINSYIVFHYLQRNQFDLVCFDCRGGAGFHTIQAKRTTQLFEQTSLVVNLDSNSQWYQDINETWNGSPVRDASQWYAERYCARYADLLISPTRHMMDWAIKNGWTLSESCYVINYNTISARADSEPRAIDYSHLVFAGPLRIHSGIEEFCQFARKQVTAGKVKKITFVGKDDWMYGYTTSRYLKKHFADQQVELLLYCNNRMVSTVQYLQQCGGLVFCPAPYVNYSWQAANSVASGLPVLASEEGGNPEILDKQCLFPVHPIELEKMYLKVVMGEILPGKPAERTAADYTPEQLFAYTAPGTNEEVRERIRKEMPLVSICMAHYNHHKFLPMALRSISTIQYPNYEVIIIDDGSSLEESRRVFNEMEAQYSLSNWHFYRKENEYLGKTRNYSVDKANGKYVVFVDADNAAKPDMVDEFLFGIYKSGADCLTCHVQCFSGIDEPDKSTPVLEVMLPLGPALELGFIQNIFGDANFIIRKEAYLKAGGFPVERLSLDDWAFLTKLTLAGFEQDVIPRQLFYYRVLEESMVRTGNNYKSMKRIFNIYSQHLPNFMLFALEGVIEPYYVKSEFSVTEGSNVQRFVTQAKRKFDHYFPKNSMRRRIFMRVAQWFGLL